MQLVLMFLCPPGLNHVTLSLASYELCSCAAVPADLCDVVDLCADHCAKGLLQRMYVQLCTR